MPLTLPLGSTITKDKDAAKVYQIDWTTFLDGLTISGAVWEITPVVDGGLEFDNDAVVGNVTRARFLGGIQGQTYRVECQLAYGSGPAQREDGEFFVYIK